MVWSYLTSTAWILSLLAPFFAYAWVVTQGLWLSPHLDFDPRHVFALGLLGVTLGWGGLYYLITGHSIARALDTWWEVM